MGYNMILYAISQTDTTISVYNILLDAILPINFRLHLSLKYDSISMCNLAICYVQCLLLT